MRRDAFSAFLLGLIVISLSGAAPMCAASGLDPLAGRGASQPAPMSEDLGTASTLRIARRLPSSSQPA